MKNILIIVTIILILATAFLLFSKKPNASNQLLPGDNTVSADKQLSGQNENKTVLSSTTPEKLATEADFAAPLARAQERITKKPFGIYITPQNSPVQPEKFRGYHTGVDFEIFPSELNEKINVSAVCSGKLRLKEYASGYGGVVVQDCRLNSESITIIYGHIKLSSIAKNSGDEIKIGEVIGVLGADKSRETDGERKHLHLGFHKGSSINIKGYVSAQSDLANWIDPCLYVCQ